MNGVTGRVKHNKNKGRAEREQRDSGPGWSLGRAWPRVGWPPATGKQVLGRRRVLEPLREAV